MTRKKIKNRTKNADYSQLFPERTIDENSFATLKKIEELCEKLHLGSNKNQNMLSVLETQLNGSVSISFNEFDEEFFPTICCRNLRVHSDHKMTVKKQVNKLRKLCYLELRKLYAFRNFFSIEQEKKFL